MHMKNNNSYRIIFVDIDWTILDHNKHDWDYPSIDILKKLQKEGLLVYLCTARPYDSVLHTGIFELFTPDGVICTNGGVAFVRDELLFANTIPEEMVRTIEKVANKHHLVLELSTNKERYFTAKPNCYVQKYFSVYAEVIPVIRKYQNKDVSAILLFAPEKYDEVLKKEFPKEMSLLRFDTCGVDVGYFKNTKGDGIIKVLKELDINKEHAIGIGDSNDDISMFKEVGLSIAMANGSDDAKASADIVTSPVSESGLYNALKEIFNKQLFVK